MEGMGRVFCLGVLLASVAACAPTGTSARSLHYVDDELVYSNPPSALAYEAYLRSRLALSSDPPQLDQARSEIEVALHFDRRAAHLWATRAEIAALQGEDDVAVSSAERALVLRPGYQPAQAVLASVRGGPAAASVTD
jgi:Tfp pilus assembly protein PilF